MWIPAKISHSCAGSAIGGIRAAPAVLRSRRSSRKPTCSIAVGRIRNVRTGFATVAPARDHDTPDYSEICALDVDPDRFEEGIGLALRRKLAIVFLRADFEKPRKSSPLRNASAFRCLHTFHVVLQLIEALVPNRPLCNHPVFGGCERLRNKMKAANAPFLARSHDAALLEHLKVLRKGRQGHAKWTRKLRRRGGSQSQPLDNSAPGRVRQRLKNATDLGTARRNSSPRSCPSPDVSAHEGTHPFCRGFDTRVRRLRSRYRRRV